jgi:hypothetical protein
MRRVKNVKIKKNASNIYPKIPNNDHVVKSLRSTMKHLKLQEQERTRMWRGQLEMYRVRSRGDGQKIQLGGSLKATSIIFLFAQLEQLSLAIDLAGQRSRS